MNIRNQIVAVARSYIGTPWRNSYGLDCVGLLIAISNTLNLSTYDIQSYSKEYRYRELINNLKLAECTLIPRYRLNNGDIVVMAMSSNGVHTGVYCDTGHIIHAYIRASKVIASKFESYEKLIKEQYSFPGVI